MAEQRSPGKAAGPAARPVRKGVRGFLRAWLLRHAQSFFYALGQIWQKPFSTLMTAAVIGIALALPAGLQVVMGNVQQVARGWDGSTQISVFLRQDTAEPAIATLQQQLIALPDIERVDYIPREQALEEFRSLSGFGEALDVLEDNPLPPVLVVYPQVDRAQGPEAVAALLDALRERPEIEQVQLDMQWVKRIYAMLKIAHRALWVLGSLLGLAVLLVLGNTIRLAIQNRRDEIVVIKLVGGTDAFIRRPFLYTGLWYGLLGGFAGLLMVQISLLLLAGPVAGLAGLYGSDFRLQGLGGWGSLGLLATGAVLGLLGSWLAVGRHLREIEPA